MHAVGLLDERGDAIPVVRNDRAQIEHRGADAFLFRLLRRDEASAAPAHPTSARRDQCPRAAAAPLPNGIMNSAAGIQPLVVRLPVEMLVLEEHHRIVAADRRPQQAGGIDARSTGTRRGCPGSARRCSRPTGCDTARRRADSRRSARESPSGTRSCSRTDSAASPSRLRSASSPARCNRRTGSRRRASVRASPCRPRGRRCWPRRAAS